MGYSVLLYIVGHFKKLLSSDSVSKMPPESKEKGPLDFEISMLELEKACKILKNGKAVGYDGI